MTAEQIMMFTEQTHLCAGCARISDKQKRVAASATKNKEKIQDDSFVHFSF